MSFSYAAVKRWMAVFKRGRESLQDDSRPGRPVTVATPEIVFKVHGMVSCDRQVTGRYIASVVGISQERVLFIPTKDLEVRKLSARWVLRLLNVDQKHTEWNMSRGNLNLFETNPDNFVLSYVTMNEC